MNPWALRIIALALSVAVAREMRQALVRQADTAGVAIAPRASAADEASATAPANDPSNSLVRIILSRPLFAPSRRPPAGTGSTGEMLPRLAGVIVGPDIRRAIFIPAKGSAIVVAEGGRAGGWEIRKIGPNEVVLAGPDGERSLRTDHAKAAPMQPKIIQGRNPAAGPQGG